MDEVRRNRRGCIAIADFSEPTIMSEIVNVTPEPCERFHKQYCGHQFAELILLKVIRVAFEISR